MVLKDRPWPQKFDVAGRSFTIDVKWQSPKADRPHMVEVSEGTNVLIREEGDWPTHGDAVAFAQERLQEVIANEGQ